MATIWDAAARRARTATSTPTGTGMPSPMGDAGAAIASVGATGGAYAPAAYDPGPTGYTISGYEPAAAMPAYNVHEDPSYLAFIAALDQAQGAAGADLLKRQSDADRNVETYKPRIAEAGVEQRRRISGGHETRGMFRSGMRLRDLGLQQRSEGQQVSDLESGAARAKSEAQSAYNAMIADLARQRAEKAMELTASRATTI